MGTLVNGIKEIFATSKSTATHLPVCASDGTPQGRISVGDLASVLGGQVKGASINYDLNNAPYGAVGSSSGSVTSSLVNAPINGNVANFLCITYKVSNNPEDQKIQEFYYTKGSSSEIQKYVRRGSYSGSTWAWSSWSSFSFDIPSFYKNYATLDELGRGLIYQGVYKMSTNQNSAVHVQIKSGFNSVLLAVCSQFTTTPSLLSLWYGGSSDKKAAGVMPPQLVVKFKGVGIKADFYISGTNATIRVISTSGADIQQGVYDIELVNVSNIPSDAETLTIGKTI